MELNEPGKANRLNTRTFAIREGDCVYVVVPVLVYAPGDDKQRAGLAYMHSLFTDNAVAPFQAMEITGNWCTLDPHNSNVQDPHNSDLLAESNESSTLDPHNSNLSEGETDDDA